MIRRTPRFGFTLVELLVVLVIGAAIAAAVSQVLRRQQRFYANAASLVEQRVHLRDAAGIIPGELRALAPGAGDVLAFSDSSLDIYATVGVAIACDTLPAGTGLDLAPARLASGTVLSAFSTAPQPGDVALVSDIAAVAVAADTGAAASAAWVPAEIATAAPVVGACASSPVLDPIADAVAPRLRLQFAVGVRLPSTVRPGAFVRVVRRIRYRFYRAGSGEWYLGYAEWSGTAFGIVQPVSGPFASYARGGFSLRYFDDAGEELYAGADATRIARITIVVRGAASEGLAGIARAAGDSQSVAVRVRNR